MAELKLNAESFDGVVSNLKSSCEKVNTSVSNIKKPSKSSGIKITDYVDRAKKISQLLDVFKELVLKDVIDIENSKEKIIEMDRKMEELYKNGMNKW